MTTPLFQRGIAPRLAVAAAYAALAFGAVALLLARPGAPATGRSAGRPAVAAAAPAALCLESVQPVAAWTVHADGAPLAPAHATATTWVGRVALAPDATLAIEAAPAAGTGAAGNAIRIRVAGTTPSRDHTVWCPRDWSVAVRLGELRPSGAPIDPDDLP